VIIKPKIVVFIDWYVPAYKAGGPIRSVYNLIETISDTYDFYVITSNSDIDGIALDAITANQWIKQGKANVLYLTSDNQTKSRYEQEVSEIKPSKIYLNSLFSSKFTLLPLLAFKKSYEIVVAPRGMLGAESLAIKSTKKKAFLMISKVLSLYKNVTWHASSKIEANEVKETFGEKATVKVASNLALVSEEFTFLNKEVGQLSILMVGRVVPIKNIHFFLSELKGLSPSSVVKVSIVGPNEDEEYYQTCLTIVKELPQNIQVHFIGSLPPIEVAKLYNQHHLLVSTSLNENYGHSIAEALTHGRPILVSNNTPWKNLDELGIGANLDLVSDLFTKKIQEFVDMENKEFVLFQKRAKRYSLEVLKNEKEVLRSVYLFT
jgi:glycosyltransferase involved in cell wall biosynthesis